MLKYGTSHWKGQIALLRLNNAYLVIEFSTLIPTLCGLILFQINFKLELRKDIILVGVIKPLKVTSSTIITYDCWILCKKHSLSYYIPSVSYSVSDIVF